MSRQYTITVVQLKGGVGRTTLAVCLAAELYKHGNTVALIDADAQRSASQWAQPGNLPFPVHEVALIDQGLTTWLHQLAQITKFFDYIVVDPAAHEYAVSASVTVSDLVIVPCTPSGLDLNATARTLELIDMVRARRYGQPRLILVPNRVDARTREGRQIRAALTGFNEVVSPTIGDRAAFVRAFTTGRPIADMPDGRTAHQEVQGLCDFVERALGISSTQEFDHQFFIAEY